jgi:hypothetical protein
MLEDAKYKQGMAWRFECAKCRHTFRAYPHEVGKKQVSYRVIGLAILLYILGLSKGAMAIMIGIGKGSVYRAAQAAAEKGPGMKPQKLLERYRPSAFGVDVTSGRCDGEWLPIEISVDATAGVTLSIDSLPGEVSEQLKAWLEPILDVVDPDVLVTNDADSFKIVSDETGRAHQICKRHVSSNNNALVDELSAILQTDQGYSLEALGVTSEQALADLAALKTLIHTCLPTRLNLNICMTAMP